MMNSLILTVLLLGCAATFSLLDPVTAFVVTSSSLSSSSSSSSSLLTSRLHAEAKATTVELKPEPEGGKEITSVKTMTGSRMKDMGEATGLTGVRNKGEEDANETVYKFWLKARVEGPLIKELHSTVLKDSAKKANFPGFRKGQVPPFAMPQIKGFAVQEGVIRTCQSAVDAYGLKSVNGIDGEVEVLEDIPEIAKVYKLPGNEGIEFTAYFNAIYDPAYAEQLKQKVVRGGEGVVNSDSDASVIDVEPTTTTTASAEETTA